MKLSEVIKAVGRGTLYRECEFDQLILFGIPYEEKKRNIAFIGGISFIPDFSKVDLAGVICTEEVKEEIKDVFQGGILVGENPKGIFLTFYNRILNKKNEEKLSHPTKIGGGSQIHKTAIIAPNNVEIGDNVTIGPFTVIEEETNIADNVVIGAHCTIGVPGFFYFEEGGKKTRVVNVGGVSIGRNAEIDSHCVVARAVFSGDTIIGENAKLDNFVFLAHDVQIGAGAIVAAGAIFGGYASVDENMFLGLQSTVVPNIKIGPDGTVSAGAVVTKNVPPNTHVSGNFAIEHSRFIRNLKGIK